MVANLIEDFASDLVRVLLFAPVEGLDPANTDWLSVVPADDVGLLPFRDFLAAAEPLRESLRQRSVRIALDGLELGG